jgi:hypothetical protein
MTLRNETERVIETNKGSAVLAGDSLYKDKSSVGTVVSLGDIRIREYDIDEYHYLDVYVDHDSDWTVYTDSGFENVVREITGLDCHWSEQGAQNDNVAHLEVYV